MYNLTHNQSVTAFGKNRQNTTINAYCHISRFGPYCFWGGITRTNVLFYRVEGVKSMGKQKDDMTPPASLVETLRVFTESLSDEQRRKHLEVESEYVAWLVDLMSEN